MLIWIGWGGENRNASQWEKQNTGVCFKWGVPRFKSYSEAVGHMWPSQHWMATPLNSRGPQYKSIWKATLYPHLWSWKGIISTYTTRATREKIMFTVQTDNLCLKRHMEVMSCSLDKLLKSSIFLSHM